MAATAHRIKTDIGLADFALRNTTDADTLRPGDQSLLVFEIVTGASGETRILAPPLKAGLICSVVLITDGGGDLTLTVLNFEQAGTGALVFDDAGDSCTFISFEVAVGTFAWRLLQFDGVTGPVGQELQTVASLTVTGELTVTGGDRTLMIALPDADTTILAANSGKIHYFANVSADRVFTLPPNAAGLYYEFWSTLISADGHDIQIIADNAADFYEGALVFHDSDAADGIPLVLVPDGSSDHTLNILLPITFQIKMYCDGTNWFISGYVFATTIPTFT